MVENEVKPSVNINVVVYLRHRVEPLICDIPVYYDPEEPPEDAASIVQSARMTIRGEMNNKESTMLTFINEAGTARVLMSEEIQAWFVIAPSYTKAEEE